MFWSVVASNLGNPETSWALLFVLMVVLPELLAIDFGLLFFCELTLFGLLALFDFICDPLDDDFLVLFVDFFDLLLVDLLFFFVLLLLDLDLGLF